MTPEEKIGVPLGVISILLMLISVGMALAWCWFLDGRFFGIAFILFICAAVCGNIANGFLHK